VTYNYALYFRATQWATNSGRTDLLSKPIPKDHFCSSDFLNYEQQILLPKRLSIAKTRDVWKKTTAIWLRIMECIRERMWIYTAISNRLALRGPRKLVQRNNELFNWADFFNAYSSLNNLCFGYFQFFLAPTKKAEKNQFTDLAYVEWLIFYKVSFYFKHFFSQIQNV